MKKILNLFFDDAWELRPVRLKRNYPAIDGLWLLGIVLCLSSAALHRAERRLTFGLSALGLLVFLACAVWQILSKRKRIVISREEANAPFNENKFRP